jgi:hypothetical protein
MGLLVTALLLLLALGVAGFANWRERRPPPLGQVPLLSYPAIQMIAVVAALVLLAHLVSLLTGHPLHSRFLR